MSTSAVRLLVISGLRFLRRAKGSSLSVYFGLTLGIVSITGVHLLGERVTASLQQLTPAHLAGITHVLTREDLNVRDYVALRDAWRRGAMPGVSALVPMREGQSREGINVVGTDWVAALDLGQNSDISPPLRFEPSPTPVALVSGGVRPRGGELLLNGVRVQVVSRSPATDTGGMAMAAVDIGTAMAILGGDPSHLDGVLVRFEDGWSLWRAALESAMPGISAGLPASAPDPGGSWRVHALASEAPMRGLASAVLFNLGALGSLALLVALLLMFQSAVIWLRRQRAVHGALTGIGVTDRELATGFVLLLVLLGIPAVASGLWTGRWLCEQLLGVMAGASFAATTVALTTAVVVKAILAGLAVCVLGGGLAWWWEHRAGHLPRALGLTFGVAALSLIAGSLLTPASGLLGIFAGIFAAALLAAFSVLPLLRRLKSAIARVRGPLWWRLGLREVVWYPDDLAVACAALSLPAVSSGVGVMVDSFRQEFTALLDQRLSADVFVTMVAGDGSEQLAVDISALPGISAVHVSGEIPIRVDGLPVQLAFGAMPAMQAARYGLTRALGDNEILLSEGLPGGWDLPSGPR
ncbi:MAG: hypothetical protein R3E84_07425 [Pseudomonadales bacterium]